MNYWISWKINVLISLLILIEGCLCCQIITDRPIEEIHEENKKSPWLVIINEVTAEENFMARLASHGYGSLVHPKLVLTSGHSFLKYVTILTMIIFVKELRYASITRHFTVECLRTWKS